MAVGFKIPLKFNKSYTNDISAVDMISIGGYYYNAPTGTDRAERTMSCWVKSWKVEIDEENTQNCYLYINIANNPTGLAPRGLKNLQTLGERKACIFGDWVFKITLRTGSSFTIKVREDKDDVVDYDASENITYYVGNGIYGIGYVSSEMTPAIWDLSSDSSYVYFQYKAHWSAESNLANQGNPFIIGNGNTICVVGETGTKDNIYFIAGNGSNQGKTVINNQLIANFKWTGQMSDGSDPNTWRLKYLNPNGCIFMQACSGATNSWTFFVHLYPDSAHKWFNPSCSQAQFSKSAP